MKRIWPFLVLAALAAAGVGAYWWHSYASAKLPDGISASNGRIEAGRIEIATRLAGRIAQVLVDEGDWVDAGDLIARMDTLELDAQLRAAQAAVRQAQQQEL